MRFVVNFVKDNPKIAFIQPRSLEGKRTLEDKTGTQFYRIEEKSVVQLLIAVAVKLFELHLRFNEDERFLNELRESQTKLYEALILDKVLTRWKNSNDVDKKEAAAKLRLEATREMETLRDQIISSFFDKMKKDR